MGKGGGLFPNQDRVKTFYNEPDSDDFMKRNISKIKLRLFDPNKIHSLIIKYCIDVGSRISEFVEKTILFLLKLRFCCPLHFLIIIL